MPDAVLLLVASFQTSRPPFACFKGFGKKIRAFKAERIMRIDVCEESVLCLKKIHHHGRKKLWIRLPLISGNACVNGARC